jgi:hypothetical protein
MNPHWIASLTWHVVMLKGRDADKTLFLTWVFGEPRWFCQAICRVNEEGVLLNGHGQPLTNLGLPSDVIGRSPRASSTSLGTMPANTCLLDVISNCRMDSLKRLETAISDPFLELLDVVNDRTKEAKFCRARDARAEVKASCQNQYFGSLMGGSKITSPRFGQFANVLKWFVASFSRGLSRRSFVAALQTSPVSWSI